MDRQNSHIFDIGCTWLVAFGRTSRHSLEFNKIGAGTNISNMPGICHNGTTIIPSAISCFIFERALSTNEIRGNALNFKLDYSILNASI